MDTNLKKVWLGIQYDPILEEQKLPSLSYIILNTKELADRWELMDTENRKIQEKIIVEEL